MRLLIRTSIRSFILCCNVAVLNGCQSDQEKLFELLPASTTHIDFRNDLKEDNRFNIIEYLYFYNGGGVALGDINHDGLTDIYFSSNQQANRLYLNQGDLHFKDITQQAGVAGVGVWKTGVTMADVNGDGNLDIYVCQVGKYKSFSGRNQLFINNGDLTFTEKAAAYGIDFQGFSTQSAFFDYDLDGDLDMYLLNHSVHTARSYGRSTLRFEMDSLAGDRLYRNDGNVFKDVTRESGIWSSHIGYGLGIGISDVNRDGYPDIYVSNDFHENDYLYLNKGDGTFEQTLEKALGHSSRFSMGNDLADFNNDLWPDIVTLDMMPRDEHIIKSSVGEDPYEIYNFKLSFGYHHQVARNTLQLSLGTRSNAEERPRQCYFSDIALLAGVEATDWSWAPLLADFDNDGFKDLFISNGIVRRPNDLDYINYVSDDSIQLSLQSIGQEDLKILDKMPPGKVSNFIFRNQGDLTFQDKTKLWGLQRPSFSNGAAYADLDNDGDLDLVVNNINEQAFIYENNARAILPNNSLTVELKGDSSAANSHGIGAKVIIYTGNNRQLQEVQPTRGWCSSVSTRLLFGLGTFSACDSIAVIWPNLHFQMVKKIRANQTIIFNQQEATGTFSPEEKKESTLLTEISSIDYTHQENDFNAFNRESLMPHMLSTEGPRMSVGDVNGDKLDDIFIGGATGHAGGLFIQHPDGRFTKTGALIFDEDSLSEDTGSAFFDADGDSDLDLIIVSGGQEYSGTSPWIRPRLYINDGSGSFTKRGDLLPEVFVNASCVKPADFDQDGDLDLFIGGHVMPWKYGVDPPSFLLVNDGLGHFRDESVARLPPLEQSGNPGISVGMVTEALWVDLNDDKKLDLILVGEWMPITILVQNRSGVLEDKTSDYGLENTNGLWKTILAGDWDHDGDIDFVLGNLGLNTRAHASREQPLKLYIGDYDRNASTDHILTYFNQDQEYPFVSRDQLVKQLPYLKRKFLSYKNYENARLEDILTADQIRSSIVKEIFTTASIYLENTGNRKFGIKLLPTLAQAFPIYSFLADDFDKDGKLDLMAVGNMFSVQPEFGRYDAGYGLILQGNGKGGFEVITPKQSGFWVIGQGRDIKSIMTSKNQRNYIVSRNNDAVKAFKLSKP